MNYPPFALLRKGLTKLSEVVGFLLDSRSSTRPEVGHPDRQFFGTIAPQEHPLLRFAGRVESTTLLPGASALWQSMAMNSLQPASEAFLQVVFTIILRPLSPPFALASRVRKAQDGDFPAG